MCLSIWSCELGFAAFDLEAIVDSDFGWGWAAGVYIQSNWFIQFIIIINISGQQPFCGDGYEWVNSTVIVGQDSNPLLPSVSVQLVHLGLLILKYVVVYIMYRT